MNVPQRTTTVIRRLNPALFGTKEQRDAFADLMLAKEREMAATMAPLPDSVSESVNLKPAVK